MILCHLVNLNGQEINPFDLQPTLINYCEVAPFCNQENYHVLQQKSGLIWIATDNGVYNYDGNTFQHFTTSEGLTTNSVYKLYEDEYERVWFTGGSKSLAYYYKGKIFPYSYNNILEKMVPDGTFIFSMIYDKNEGLSVSLGHGGLLRISPQGKVKGAGEVVAPKDILKPDGVYLFQQNDEIVSYYINKNKLKLDNSRPYTIFIEKFKSPDSTFLITHQFPKVTSTKDVKGSPITYAITTTNNEIIQITYEGFLHITTDSIKYVNVPSSIVFAKDINGEIWLGARQGVYVYDPKKQTVEWKPFLRNYTVSSVEKDHNGGYWFSTLQNGLFYAPSFSSKHVPLTSDGELIEDVIQSDDGYSILLRNGNLIQTTHNERKTYKRPKNNEIYLDLARDTNGTIYSSGTQLISYNNGKVEATPLGSSFLREISCWNNQVIACSKREFFIFDKKEIIYQKNIGLNTINALEIIKDTAFILCESGIHIIDIKTKSHTYQEIEDPIDLWENMNKIQGITKNGIFIIRNKQGKFRLSNSIPRNITINSVLTDSNSLYLASNRGILEVDKKTRQVLSITGKSQGLVAQNILCVFKEKDQLVYFTRHKMGIISTPLIKHKKTPKIHSLLIEYDGKRKHVKDGETIYVNEREKYFAITPISYVFEKTSPLKYLYQLEGVNTNYQNYDAPTINYSGIGGGTYPFTIRSSIDDISYSNAVNIIIVVQKPFWKTNYFILAMLILFFLITILLFRLILYRHRKKETFKREIVELKFKALSSQINPHFIFNFLNSLQLKILKNESEMAIKQLGVFCDLIRKNLSHFSKNLISIEAELELAEKYLYLEKIRFKEQLNYSIQVDPNLQLEAFSLPPLVLQPFLENAIHHGFYEKKGYTELIIHLKETQRGLLEIKIKDNGIGFDPGKVKKDSYGIAFTRQRVKLMNVKNEINIDSAPGKNTTILIIIRNQNRIQSH